MNNATMNDATMNDGKMNEKFSIPHKAASYGIENFLFIVSELVQVNPDNSQAMSALTCK